MDAAGEGVFMGMKVDNTFVEYARGRGAVDNYAVRIAKRALAEHTGEPSIERETRREEVIEAGFGENTVSVPGVTIRTLNRNLLEARNAVPSAAELRQEAAVRSTQRRQQIQEQISTDRQRKPGPARPEGAKAPPELPPEEPPPRAEVQRVRPEASAQVRNFTQEPVRRPETAHEKPPAAYEAPSPAPGTPVTPARLDVLA